MRFNPAEPYAEVIGIPGVIHEQHGRRFNPGGREVLLSWVDGEPVVAEAPEDEPDPRMPADEGYAGLHWRALKALVEAAGGEWTNKESALRFLNGAA